MRLNMAQMSDGKSDGKPDKSADHRPVQETKLPQPDDMLQPPSIGQIKENLLYERPDVENRVAESDNTVVDRPCRTPPDGGNDNSSSPEPVEHEELDSINSPGAKAGNGLKPASDSTIEDEYLKSDKDIESTEIPVDHFPIQTQSNDTKGELCPSDSYSNSSSSVDFRMRPSSLQGSISYSYCDECELLKSTCPSKESLDFWHSIPQKGSGEIKCHKKYMKCFCEKLKEKYPDDESFKNKITMSLLRYLLEVGLGDTAEVSLSSFVKLVRFFGPVRSVGGDQSGKCALLHHLHLIATKSLKAHNKSKISWFAGDVSRENSEGLLQGCENGTYLVRMSQSNAACGNFVVSVKYDGRFHHFEIEGHPKEASNSSPFNASLELKGKRYSSLPDLVEGLTCDFLQDDEDDDKTQVWCRKIFAASPLNHVIQKYKSARR